MVLYGEVVEVRSLTPHMVRVVMGGEGLGDFEPTGFTDQYVNALFIPDGSPWTVPFDWDEAKAGDASHCPRGRRYTIRSWDPVTRRVTIDFVVHGEVGLAGRWAANARAGDRLQMVGPSGGYRPADDAEWHLMVGDESALPAIGASLDVLAPGRRAVVVAIVDDADHELAFSTAGDLRVVWVHRTAEPDDDGLLVKAVEALDFPPGSPDVFVHGEAAEVRAVRKHLLGERGLAKDGSSISPYWRRTLDDEAWRKVKKDWLAEAEADV